MEHDCGSYKANIQSGFEVLTVVVEDSYLWYVNAQSLVKEFLMFKRIIFPQSAGSCSPR
jgi:hypothetical protein